jgi:hypothetical protein
MSRVAKRQSWINDGSGAVIGLVEAPSTEAAGYGPQEIPRLAAAAIIGVQEGWYQSLPALLVLRGNARPLTTTP